MKFPIPARYLYHMPVIILMIISGIFGQNRAYAQLPECGKVYMDRYNGEGPSDIDSAEIFIYDPFVPLSETNPAPNTIKLPPASGGLAISTVLSTSGSMETFYTIVDGYYYYLDPFSLLWINTGHIANNSGVNIGAGGGYIYNLNGNEGSVSRYDGTSSTIVIASLDGFPSGGPYDMIADCEGNFYILRIGISDPNHYFRKYNPSGVLLQEWDVDFPPGYYASAGFVKFDTTFFRRWQFAWMDPVMKKVLFKGILTEDELAFSNVPIELEDFGDQALGEYGHLRNHGSRISGDSIIHFGYHIL
ncbi:MAG: hypothetical protein KL787_00680 [Taibaiella sp.]|nr:hypothetical protein [Taibaiella sp.]MBX9448304.1 hypothetical protein [Taibaiella sp.]